MKLFNTKTFLNHCGRDRKKKINSFKTAKKLHAVCIPLPFQSHINVMLKLSKLLHLKGFHITFVNTKFNHNKILKSRGPDSLKGLHDFRFETVPDGLPHSVLEANKDLLAICESTETDLLAPFVNLITKINHEALLSEPAQPQVTCIISDALMTFTLDAGQEIGIPCVLLWPMSACFLMIYLHFDLLIEKGINPLKDGSNLTNMSLEMPSNLIPGLRNFRVKDFPNLWLVDKPSQDFMVGQCKRILKASGIIINTFDALENEVLEALKPLATPIYTMGPLQLLGLQEIPNHHLNSVGSNLWKEDRNCLNWLDSKKPSSVVYINFGTHTSLTPREFIEFAWGLANCRHHFLWVIRPDLVAGEAAILPHEFIKETEERGMISGWCPQEQVLCHSSVGGFLTHSGWNSTMETICGGVPVISWPFFGDQQHNRRYACFHWGIGMEMDKIVERHVVEKLIRELMEGEDGKEMKKNVMEFKKSAEASTKPGGSSDENFDRMIKMLACNRMD